MESKYSDPSLKPIDILEALRDAGGDGLGITEVANMTGLHKSTVHRIMVALTKRGYITRNDITKKFNLSYKILQFSIALTDNLEIRDIAKPFLKKLSEDLGEAIHLIIQDGNYGVYIDRIDSPQPIGLQSYIGKRILLHSSAAGKVILAYMNKEERDLILSEIGLPKFTEQTIVNREKLENELFEVIQKGFAWNRGENRDDVYSIAAPIFNATGKIAGTLSVAGPSYRFTKENVNRMISTLTSTTKQISKMLGYPGANA